MKEVPQLVKIYLNTKVDLDKITTQIQDQVTQSDAEIKKAQKHL